MGRRPDSRAATRRHITRFRVDVAASPRDSCLRLGVRARDRLHPSEPIGGRGHYGQTRHGRARSSPSVARSRLGESFASAPFATNQLASIGPPLLRFGPLQHTLAAMRCPGLGSLSLAGLRTIPLRRFGFPSARATAGGPARRILRPCGFSPSAEQSGVARSGGRFWLVHALRTRHTIAITRLRLPRCDHIVLAAP